MTDFSDLDDLLASATQAQANKAKAKSSREQLKSPRLTAAQRAALEAELEVIEMSITWTAVAVVAVMEHHTCSCGAEHSFFSHTMTKQQHKDGKSLRYIRCESVDPKLPRTVARTYFEVPFCTECMEGKGWDLSQEDTSWEL